MSDENGTVKQRIELEDRVTPALDNMLKSIQSTTTAMGDLLESVERFQNVASHGGFNINFEQTADAIRNISDAYETATRNAQGLMDASNNIQSASSIPSTIHPVSPEQSAEPSTQSMTFSSEFEKIRDNFSEIFSHIESRIFDVFDVSEETGNTITRRLSAARTSVRTFGTYVLQRFQSMREQTANRLEPMTTSVGNAFSRVRELANKHLMPFVNIARMSFSRLGVIIKEGLSNVCTTIRDKLNINNLLSVGFGKVQMIAGTIFSIINSLSSITSISDARSNSIAQLNQLGEEARNGYNADELRDFSVKYANRIGMSSNDFMGQSMQLMNSTGGAFGSIGEAMNYNELMQKQMKISGVDANAANSVAIQWRQGLTKGFASQEINTVLEQAPVLAQRLADTMGIEMGELKDAASKGMITAEVAKRALFDNAEDINAKFAAMPKTWEQIGATIKNNAARALDPLLQKISDLAQNPAIEAMTDKLVSGFTWFAEVADTAFGIVLNTMQTIVPYVEEIVTPIKNILFSVWDIISGLIDDIVEMFTKDEEFGRTAQVIWGDFKIILERLKPVVEGFVETIAGGIKILLGVAKNIITLYENARTGLHNIFSDDELEYKSFDTDIFVKGASQIAGGIKKGVGESVGLIGDILTKHLGPGSPLDEIANKIQSSFGFAKDWFTRTFMGDKDDRIQAGMTPSKPLHVKQVGKTKIDKESLQLLKDLAQAEIINRVNNIQPTITATFGDVHETADVDVMLDRLEKDVVSARGQNLMLQTGMQYAL